MKRIAIVWPGFTGYAAPCYQALSRQCELRLYFEKSPYEQLFDAVGLEGLYWRRIDDATAVDEVVSELKDWSPHLILSCGWSTPLCRAVANAKVAGSVKVLAMDMPWEWSVRKIAARFLLRRFLRNFDGMFVPGNKALRYAIWLGFSGRVSVGMNPSGWEHFSPQDGKTDKRRTGFIYVGRFAYEKGLDVLLAAYKRYRESSSDPWPLMLVGSGDAIPMRYPEGVNVRGFVRPSDMPRVMGENACLILPSRWEPWGVCVAEAMSAGLTTIVSDACGIVHDVRPTFEVKSGSVASLADAMARASQNIGLGTCVERGSHRTMECYSSERWSRRVLAMADRRFDAEVGA